LGHVFDKRGVAVDTNKFSIIQGFPVPNTVKRVRSFLGLANYYRQYVKAFSQIFAPLRNLLKTGVPFVWTEECQAAFEQLKHALITAPVLRLPRFSEPFVLTCGASYKGIAYILGQRDETGREHAIAYGGRGLRPNEEKWPVTHLECLALVKRVRQFHTYLAGNTFEIVTDHVFLTFLQRMKMSENNRLARWAMFLQGYKFKTTHKKGATLTSADAISRMDNMPKPADEWEAEEAMVCTLTDFPGRVHIEFGTPEVGRQTSSVFAAKPGREHMLIEPNLDEYTSQVWQCLDFAPMMRFLTLGQLPENDDDARKIALSSTNYIILDGVLYHFHTPRAKNLGRAVAIVRQFCVPTALRPEIATGLHERNGHVGFDRLYALASSKFFWPGMYTFLRQHVLTYVEYQQSKWPIKPGKTLLTSLTVPPPLTRFHMDFHVPLPLSRGERYILVLIDSTSMWTELIAVEDTTAETVVRALFDNVIARFSVPSGLSILTDNGSAFIAQSTKLFCRNFGIKQFFTTPYHPQTNVRAEELADTIHNSLRTICKEQSEWADHLQAIAKAYRATPTTKTSLSPHKIVFGRPMKILDGTLPAADTPVASAEQYAREIAPKLEILGRIAMDNAAASAGCHRRRHDEGARNPEYAVGNKVLLHNVTLKRGESIKLKRRYTGPFIITKCRPRFSYKLQLVETGRD
jgi:transposase InsO family protein